MSSSQYCTLVVFVLLFVAIYKALCPKRRLPLPPGPPLDPVIGHLRHLLKANDNNSCYQWHKQYGNIIHMSAFGKSIIFLNNEKVANDLLEKRSAIYNDRPYFPLHEMIGWDKSLAMLPFGNEFFRTRKLFQDALPRRGVFEELQTHQAHVFLRNLVIAPDAWRTHIMRFASAIILEITYGHTVESDEDPYLTLSNHINKIASGINCAEATILDVFPPCISYPGSLGGSCIDIVDVRHMSTSRTFSAITDNSGTTGSRLTVRHIEDFSYQEVREKLAAGGAKPSFLSTTLENLHRMNNESEEEIARLKTAGIQFYAAGAETTWFTIENCLFALMVHPRVQKKAQAEVDSVLEQRRLPNFGDREVLPYVECVLQESMRWNPTTPSGGIPHRVMEDDVYCGMLIPKGSTIIVNTRCMTKDEQNYHSPQTFFPERYLPKPDGNGEPFPRSAFGFGRRICPGRHLAEGTVWIAIASFLAVFDISPGRDEYGDSITPKIGFTSGVTRRVNVVGRAP